MAILINDVGDTMWRAARRTGRTPWHEDARFLRVQLSNLKDVDCYKRTPQCLSSGQTHTSMPRGVDTKQTDMTEILRWKVFGLLPHIKKNNVTSVWIHFIGTWMYSHCRASLLPCIVPWADMERNALSPTKRKSVSQISQYLIQRPTAGFTLKSSQRRNASLKS